MSSQPQYRRRVGTVRPSHLMFTSGVGSLVDLPNFSVLVRGIDEWDYSPVTGIWQPLVEPRLLDATRHLLGPSVAELRPPPWLDGADTDPHGPATRTGVPVLPFPQWFRCTACDLLAALDSGVWGYENDVARRPDLARFFHKDCPRRKRKPLAVAARFVLSCVAGHLDEFPYVHFVHRGAPCPDASHPTLRMRDYGGNMGANVQLICLRCDSRRNIREAMGVHGGQNLPRCRGRHPHLGTFADFGCDNPPKLLVVGAANQWFARTLSALAVPETGTSALQTKVTQLWDTLKLVSGREVLDAFWELPQYQELREWTKDEVWEAIEHHRTAEQETTPAKDSSPDLLSPEWQIFTASPAPLASSDFVLRRDPSGVPGPLAGLFDDVVQVERLREVRALVGFTRLDAPDPDDPEMVQRAPLSRSHPQWVPASDVRGEGIFLRVPEDLLADWEQRVDGSLPLREHFEAYKRFRTNRYSDRIPQNFDPERGWPGARYIALHTLSHLLIRTIAVECGYSAASLSERIYTSTADEQRAGILIYTAVPDAEGTLGGLVSLAEHEPFVRLVRRALDDAMRCSSDPLCAERLPRSPADFLHGAACHVCLFVSETTCERGNRFLDRRFVVPIDEPKLALVPDPM